MNTAAKTFLIAIAAVAAAAATGVGLANRMAAPAPRMVKLERVVVIARRASPTIVARLPRVVVEGRRDMTTLAAAQLPVWIV